MKGSLFRQRDSYNTANEPRNTSLTTLRHAINAGRKRVNTHQHQTLTKGQGLEWRQHELEGSGYITFLQIEYAWEFLGSRFCKSAGRKRS